MAKVVSYPDGSRMLVSDDMPDIDYGDDDLIPVAKQTNFNKTQTEESVSFVTMCLCFKQPLPAFAFRASKLVVLDNKVKIIGSMLIDDFFLLLENKEEIVSYLEIETQERTFQIAKNYRLQKAVAKEMDSIYVLVDLLLLKHN